MKKFLDPSACNVTPKTHLEIANFPFGKAFEDLELPFLERMHQLQSPDSGRMLAVDPITVVPKILFKIQPPPPPPCN